MTKRSHRLNLETLETRAVLNVGPTDILSISAEHNEWQLNGTAEPSTVSVNAEGDLSRWTPELYGDFNGDNVDDVLGRLDDGDFWLQVNDGQQLHAIRWGEALDASFEIIGSGDFNDDGRLDLISIDRTTGQVQLSVNAQNGFFLVQAGTLPEGEYEQLFIDDFNGDGRLDLLATVGQDWWLVRNETGTTFQVDEWGLTRYPDFEWLAVVSGDFNGDDTADVAALGPDRTWWVWFGESEGFPIAQFWGHWKMRDTWHDIAVGDFNNDGSDDVIGRTEDGRLWVGTSTDTRFHTWTWSAGWVNRAEWSHVTVTDIDGDGLDDQVGKAKDDNWYYALNQGDNSFNNFFWQNAVPTEFTVLSNNFQRDEVIDLVPGLPTGGTDVRDAEVTVSINAENKLVLSGNDVSMIGVEILSESGSLIPVADDSSAPFEVLLFNDETQFSAGSFAEPFVLNGDFVMNVGWDPDSTAMDLVVNYAPDATLLDAVVFEPAGTVPMPVDGTLAENNGIYIATLTPSRTVFPDLGA